MKQTILVLIIIVTSIANAQAKREDIKAKKSGNFATTSKPAPDSAIEYLLPDIEHKDGWPDKLTYIPRPTLTPANFEKELKADRWTSLVSCNGAQPDIKTATRASSKDQSIQFEYEDNKKLHTFAVPKKGDETITCRGTYEIQTKDHGQFFIKHDCVFSNGAILADSLVTPVTIQETEELGLLIKLTNMTEHRKYPCKDGTTTNEIILIQRRPGA